MLGGVLGFIVFGAGVAYYGYQNTIYPVDKSIGLLYRAESAQTSQEVANYVSEAKTLIPKSGNPVWSFPTARTDFGLIQNELSNIIARSNSLSSMQPQSADYNTGLVDMHATIKVIEENLIESMPYLFVSFANVILSSLWIGVILLIFAVMRRGRAKFKKEEYERP